MTDHTHARSSYEDWNAVMEDLLHGPAEEKQRLAWLKLNRLISGFLLRLRAWDKREEWEDLRQIVLEKLVKSFVKGQLHEAKAFVAFAQTITRNEFSDFLKKRPLTQNVDDVPGEELPAHIPFPEISTEARMSVRTAVQNLPEQQRKAVHAIYIEDLTYDEAARVTAIPLGSFKRYLRQGLTQLREQLAGVLKTE